MKLAIYGYGNVSRGVESAIAQNADMELVGVFTRRDPAKVTTVSGAPVFAAAELEARAADIDVLVICGGSATDLPVMTPALARLVNVVDSFDTHARIPEHFAAVDEAATGTGHTALISGGWDPGLFSLARLYANAALPQGTDYTFWGRGVSQGHSDAVRRIEGVADARSTRCPCPRRLKPSAPAKLRPSPPARSTPGRSSWWPRRGRTGTASCGTSSPCPTISTNTTPPSPSSPPRR